MAKHTHIEGYGVRLHRLTRDRTELLRYWRNHPEIQHYMELPEIKTEHTTGNTISPVKIILKSENH